MGQVQWLSKIIHLPLKCLFIGHVWRVIDDYNLSFRSVNAFILTDIYMSDSETNDWL